MSKRNYKKKKIQKNIAKKRIEKLFNLAEKQALKGCIRLSDRYVEIARKISMRYLTSIPKYYKRFFCKHCYRYMLPGKTCRVRIQNKKIIFFCYNCKKFTRIPINNQK